MGICLGTDLSVFGLILRLSATGYIVCFRWGVGLKHIPAQYIILEECEVLGEIVIRGYPLSTT